MHIALNVLLLLIGFVLLIKGADFFVDGAASVARLLGVPGFVIGLTVVAMGTSAPEAAVSVTASLANSNQLAISNVVGSNIFNLLMVCGFCAIIKPYKIDKVMLRRDFPINVVISFVLIILMVIGNVLGYLNGILLLCGICTYVVWVVLSAFKHRDKHLEEDVKTLAPLISALCILGGLAAIILGGQLVVNNAKAIALFLGWSETFVGLTIVAIGTSLPELVTSLVAARKGESGLALGNVIGSNIFNILFILGLASVVNPIPVDSSALINVGIMTGVTALMYLYCALKKGMGRIGGIVCVSSYFAYTAYLLLTTMKA